MESLPQPILRMGHIDPRSRGDRLNPTTKVVFKNANPLAIYENLLCLRRKVIEKPNAAPSK
jgi:hypothetical protein